MHILTIRHLPHAVYFSTRGTYAAYWCARPLVQDYAQGAYHSCPLPCLDHLPFVLHDWSAASQGSRHRRRHSATPVVVAGVAACPARGRLDRGASAFQLGPAPTTVSFGWAW
eukprot:362529-Chlamydomonas_euryale.AAC.7